MKNIRKSQYFRIGATIFIAGALLILFRQLVTHFDGFKAGVSSFNTIISPFVYGFVIAYLLAPIFNAWVRLFYPRFSSTKMKKSTALNTSKGIALALTLIIFIAALAGLFAAIVPQATRTIIDLIDTLPSRLNQLQESINSTLDNMSNQQAAEQIRSLIDKAEQSFESWLTDSLQPKIISYVTQASSGLLVTLKQILNFFIGIIVSAYFLLGKERFKAQFRKFTYSVTTKEKAADFFDFADYSNKTFSGFISGKIIDSIIIGFICYFLMLIIKLPYPVLISSIIGVTNIIPFFGPFIGAIPSAALIFLESPIQALIFIIMIFALQQFDGNILGPAILGKSTRLASFWVMFAILVGGGLFGFTGMILGVPLFAIIYHYLGLALQRCLIRKGLEPATEEYMDFDKYKVDRKDIFGDSYADVSKEYRAEGEAALREREIEEGLMRETPSDLDYEIAKDKAARSADSKASAKGSSEDKDAQSAESEASVKGSSDDAAADDEDAQSADSEASVKGPSNDAAADDEGKENEDRE